MELRLAFFIIGTISILGVLIHGIWKMRRQDGIPEREDSQRIEPVNTDKASSESGFDELGVGNVRVISSTYNDDDTDELESLSDNTELNEDVEETWGDDVDAQDIVDDVPSISEIETVDDTEPAFVEKAPEPPMYASVVTQPKPHMTSSVSATTEMDDIPEPPGFLLKEEKSEPDFGLSATPAAPSTEVDSKPEAKRVVKHRTTPKRRKEPTLGKDQMNIDFDDNSPKLDEADKVSAANAKPSVEIQSEVLAINVRAAEGESLSGAALLPLLLTLGFKFGEHDIFHRHVNANGKGPVLFSLANMVKPGVFDIDNLETFSTQGISLFMVLPIEGDPHQVFNMMHNAARKVADEFSGQLLDGRRSILTKQGIQQYVEKIREFERQRIISKSTM